MDNFRDFSGGYPILTVPAENLTVLAADLNPNLLIPRSDPQIPHSTV